MSFAIQHITLMMQGQDVILKELTAFLNSLDISSYSYNKQIQEFRNNYSSLECKWIYEFFTNIFLKIMNNNHSEVMQEHEAIKLLQLSRLQLVYSQLDDDAGVGHCANNIGNLHMQAKRFEEAILSYRMAILYGNIELYKLHTSAPKASSKEDQRSQIRYVMKKRPPPRTNKSLLHNKYKRGDRL